MRIEILALFSPKVYYVNLQSGLPLMQATLHLQDYKQNMYSFIICMGVKRTDNILYLNMVTNETYLPPSELTNSK